MSRQGAAGGWEAWRDQAERRDRDDPWRWLPNRFARPAGLYFDGNSLGLMHRAVGGAVRQVLAEWRDLGVMGWNHGRPPWYTRAEEVAALLAPLIGAAPGQVMVGGSTTVNLHQLLATFYRPTASRSRIVIDSEAFPTDRYAVESHLRLRGRDPHRDLVVVPAGPDRLLDDDAILQAFREDVALAVLPSVVYTTAQRLDLARMTRGAHARGVMILWDLSHSAGLYPHTLVEDEVDAAVFCTYKYLNGGPGAPAALFVHPRHLPVVPGLWGWWGSDKTRQFEMAPDFRAAADAGALQLGTPNMLALAPLVGTLPLLAEVGIDALWARSQALLGFLSELVEQILTPRGFHPIRPPASGGHLALRHPAALALNLALRARRVIVDFRPPDILRVAPAPLTTRYREIVDLVEMLAQVADEHGADPVSDAPPVV